MNNNTIIKSLNEIAGKLERIESQLKKSGLEDYISEADAKKRFKRGTTWFWERRQDGLKFYKLGGEVYYKISELVDWIEGNAK